MVALGIRLDDVGAALANVATGLQPPVVRWTLGDEEFIHRSRSSPEFVASTLPPVDRLRLAVETTAEPIDVVRRLLQADDVASAFVAVQRPPAALRRRQWRWPLRIGLVGFPEGAANQVMAAIRRRHRILPRMLQVWRIEDDPSAVDILVLPGPLPEAVDRLIRLRPVANAVLVVDTPHRDSSVVEAQLATARASTAAVASALIPSVKLPELFAAIVAHSSHAQPFDVALTAAAGRETLLWAEPDALAGSALPEIAVRMADEIERIGPVSAEMPLLMAAPRQLRVAAEAAFDEEMHEATRITEIRAAIEPELEKVDETRWCQAYVGTEGDNVLHRGRNPVSVFIGPLEEGALVAPTEFDEEGLPWEDERADAFRLTVVFIPPGEAAVPQQAEVELPRFGRSGTARFELEVARGVVEARILVVFRNRVLQSALLRGRVGKKATLSEVVAWVPSLSGLDDRRPFDVALFANHANGQPRLARHANGRTRISVAPGVPPIAERIARLLVKAADDRRSIKGGLRSKAAQEALIDLAVKGHDLYEEIEGKLGGFEKATRIQIVSASSTWFLPLEIVYSRKAPHKGAAICENYLDDPATCDGRCNLSDARKWLCPNAFWGLSKTIERHRFDLDLEPDLEEGHVLAAAQRIRRDRIPIERALFGASRRVHAKDSATTVKALGHGATAVASWEEWEQALTAQETQLLVLLPHTDYADATLEIASKTLERGLIEESYVTGNREGVSPILVLFGCRTVGSSGDPAGYAARFMKHASMRALRPARRGSLSTRTSQRSMRGARWRSMARCSTITGGSLSFAIPSPPWLTVTSQCCWPTTNGYTRSHVGTATPRCWCSATFPASWRPSRSPARRLGGTPSSSSPTCRSRKGWKRDSRCNRGRPASTGARDQARARPAISGSAVVRSSVAIAHGRRARERAPRTAARLVRERRERCRCAGGTAPPPSPCPCRVGSRRRAHRPRAGAGARAVGLGGRPQGDERSRDMPAAADRYDDDGLDEAA
jgi:hypothetical protein